MQARQIVERFASCRSGAVTVDWVALSAAIVIAGMGVGYTIFDGAGEVGVTVQDNIGLHSGNIVGAVPSGLPGGG